jgi:GCC2 and GCC3.
MRRYESRPTPCCVPSRLPRGISFPSSVRSCQRAYLRSPRLVRPAQESGMLACIDCPAGHRSVSNGTSCHGCGAGWYQPSSGQLACLKCAAGRWSAEASFVCTDCEGECPCSPRKVLVSHPCRRRPGCQSGGSRTQRRPLLARPAIPDSFSPRLGPPTAKNV